MVTPEADEPRPARPRPEDGQWSPPSCTVHRRSVTEALGGWRDYREITVTPEIDLWRRARVAGFAFRFVPRLTAIKFSASTRRGVYRTRPSHEQAAWSARIASEPNREATLLAEIGAGDGIVRRLSDRELARQLVPELIVRASRQLRRPAKLLA